MKKRSLIKLIKFWGVFFIIVIPTLLLNFSIWISYKKIDTQAKEYSLSEITR
jgi:hypothetical protein